MTKPLSRRAAIAFDGVERTEINGPPTAFRIWRAGDNTTDHGPTVFTERSCELLLEQQERRGNRYNIDVNHLSLSPDAPLQNQRAVGWFSIAVRDGELWAVDVEWTDTVRDGLTKNPPEWRYHSPAYDVDPDSGEVLSLTNLALTNNPATWSVTALATSGATAKGVSPAMKLADIKAAFEGADEDKKAAAWAAIARAMASSAGEGGDESEKKDSKADHGDEPEKKDSKKASEHEPEKKDSKKASEHEPEKKDSADEPKKASEDEPEKKDSIAATVRRLVRAELEPVERKQLLASRPDFSKELVAVLANAPIETVKKAVETMPRAASNLSDLTTVTVQATRGAGQGEGEASRLPAEQKQKLDERMGLKPIRATVRSEGVHQIFPALTPDEARSVLESKSSKNGAK